MTHENLKKLLLIAGIVIIIACVICLALAALNYFAYHRVLDGSPELYDRLHRRMIVFLALGFVLAIPGAASFIIRSVL